MAERGRPSKYTPELAAEICRRLELGESLRAICRTEGYPSPGVVLDWVERHADFSSQYARARNTGYKLLAEEILDISDDSSGDTIIKKRDDGTEYEVPNSEWTNRSRLRVDTRKWLLSKMLPKIYGDKLELAGQLDIDIAQRITQARKRAAPKPEDDGSDLV